MSGVNRDPDVSTQGDNGRQNSPHRPDGGVIIAQRLMAVAYATRLRVVAPTRFKLAIHIPTRDRAYNSVCVCVCVCLCV